MKDSPPRIVDTNVSLFRWPFRRLSLDTTESLVKKLRTLGVSQAWAGSFEGLLHYDIAGVNERLAGACREYPELVPIGSVHVGLPDWQEDLRRCFDVHQMPGVRVHPNYHGYTLGDARFAQLLKLATAAGRFVQIAAVMEDTRTQSDQMRVDDVDLTPLPEVIASVPGARVQILNNRPRAPLLDALAKTPGVSFDTARVEATDGVPNLMRSVPSGRVMFGSHAPFLILEAALIRVHESGQLDGAELRQVFSQNAEQILEATHA